MSKLENLEKDLKVFEKELKDYKTLRIERVVDFLRYITGHKDEIDFFIKHGLTFNATKDEYVYYSLTGPIIGINVREIETSTLVVEDRTEGWVVAEYYDNEDGADERIYPLEIYIKKIINEGTFNEAKAFFDESLDTVRRNILYNRESAKKLKDFNL